MKTGITDEQIDACWSVAVRRNGTTTATIRDTIRAVLALHTERAIACPHCWAAAGKPCMWPETTSGPYRDRSHADRIQAFYAQD
jgi:hypothetical protein